MARILRTKAIGETILVEFNFRDVMLWGEELTGATVTVEVWSGLDVQPSLMLDGAANYGEVTVGQYIQAGQAGVIYNLVASATGDSGSTYVKTKRLAVVSDSSSFAPSDFPQLTGALPDARVGVFYSESLLIAGGYQPYEFDDISAGIAPGWMSFNVVDNHLVCSGTPNEGAATIYTFTPQIRDAVNNLANDPQIFTVNTMVLSGDLGDGILAQTISGTYSQVGGTEPVTYTVDSGTFPAGVALSSDGSYSGEFSASTTYSWRIKGVDANGVEAFLDDTCAVSQPEFMVIGSRTSGQAGITRSTDTTTWVERDITGGNTSLFRNANTIVKCSLNTAQVSTNNGVSFTGCTGLVSDSITSGIYSNGNWILLQGNRASVSTNGGFAYSGHSMGSSWFYGQCGVAIGNLVVCAGTSSSFSTNKGISWTGSGSLLFGTTTPTEMATDGISRIRIIAVSNVGDPARFWEYNGNNSWTQEPTSPFSTGSGYCCIAYDPVKKRWGALSGRQFAYADAGGPWVLVGNVIPSGYVRADLYALSGCSGKWIISCDNGSDPRVYSSLDGGLTWGGPRSLNMNYNNKGTNMTVIPPA